MKWYGAGGPAYYLEEDGQVVAILFWLDADIAQGEDDDDIAVIDAGWSVVLTANAAKYDLDEAAPLTGLSDEAQVEVINHAVEAATRLVREEG